MNESKELAELFRHAMITIKTHMFRQIKNTNIGPQHLLILFFTRSGSPVKMKLIADKLKLTTSAVTYLVDHLEKEKLIQRIRSEKDRRVTLIAITEKGINFIDEFEKKRFAFLVKTLQEFNPETRGHITAFYKKLIENMSKELNHEN